MFERMRRSKETPTEPQEKAQPAAAPPSEPGATAPVGSDQAPATPPQAEPALDSQASVSPEPPKPLPSAPADAEASPTGKGRKSVAETLGEITWILTQSTTHKTMFISDLEWLVMAPVMMQQFRVFHAEPSQIQNHPERESPANNVPRPVGVLFWAMVNEEVAARLAEGKSRLRPQDWRSGDQLWVVGVVAPFGGAEQMIMDLKENVFPDRPVRFAETTDGNPVVRTL